jgi:hypothetical protein
MSTRTPRSPYVSVPLLSTSSSGGGYKPQRDRQGRLIPPALISCTQNGVVYTLVGFWCVWMMCVFLLYLHPSLLDPLAHRHAASSRALALSREHDGVGHVHRFVPGMSAKGHGAHVHGEAEISQAKVTPVPEAPKKITIPGINDLQAEVIKQQPAPVPVRRAGISGAAEATEHPPRSSSTVQGATSYPPGLTRRTPSGASECNVQRSTDERTHQVWEPFSLPEVIEKGSPDDYSSDEAPLRQLEVASVNTKRATYEWGKSTKQKGVLVYMCTSDPEDIQQLRDSLTAISQSFTSLYDYPIAIFHEDFTPALMRRVQEVAPDTFIYFVKIRFQLPKHLHPLLKLGTKTVRHRIPNPQHPTGWHEHEHGLKPYVKRAENYPFGYQHMCRFFSGAGFLLPFFDAFDWYWRLDSDTICNGRAEYDVFDRLSACGFEYSHLGPLFGDGGDVVEGLYNTVTNFTQERGQSHDTFGARMHFWIVHVLLCLPRWFPFLQV